MPIETPVGNLDIKNATLRTSNLETQNIKIGSIFVNSYPGLETTANVRNSMSNTIQFTNTHTAFTTTGNVSVGKELTVSGFVGSSGTGALTVPGGTTGQRPEPGVNGMFRYNSETGYMEAHTVHTATGWAPLGLQAPTVTSISPVSVPYTDTVTQVFTVSGSGFDAVTNIQLRGADGTNYDVADFEFTNSGSIEFNMGNLATGQDANRPFKVVVTNGAGLSATSTTTLGLEGVTWSSPVASSTNEFRIGTPTSLTLSATDGVGGSDVTYSYSSGTYLSGTFTLIGSTITGTTNAAENATTSVTIRATDTKDISIFSDRTFTLKAVPDTLYPFSTHTFTPGFTTIQTNSHSWLGPTKVQLQNDYNVSWDTNPNWFDVPTQGYQLWTVPVNGTYRILVIGAQGGVYAKYGAAAGPNFIDQTYNNTTYRGNGGKIQGDITLTQNQKLLIVVGQTPRQDKPNWEFANAIVNTGWVAGAGGGGSFVTLGTTKANAVPILIAGGGAGPGTGTTGVKHHGGSVYQTGSTSTTFNSTTATAGNTNGGGYGGGFTDILGFTVSSTGGGSYHAQSFRSGMQGGQQGSTGCWGAFGGGGGGGGNPGGGGGGASPGTFATAANNSTPANYNKSGDGGSNYAATNVVSNITQANGAANGNANGHGSVVITLIS